MKHYLFLYQNNSPSFLHLILKYSHCITSAFPHSKHFILWQGENDEMSN